MTKDDLPGLLKTTKHLMQTHFDDLSNETKEPSDNMWSQ